MREATALRKRAVSLAERAHELDNRAKDNPGVPMHEQSGFRAWRRDAGRFLDDRRDALRDRLMAPHLDRSSVRGMLETSASVLEHERFRAPKQTKRQTVVVGSGFGSFCPFEEDHGERRRSSAIRFAVCAGRPAPSGGAA